MRHYLFHHVHICIHVNSTYIHLKVTDAVSFKVTSFGYYYYLKVTSHFSFRVSPTFTLRLRTLLALRLLPFYYLKVTFFLALE